MSRSSLRSRTFQRILLIKPSAFGDVLHTLPVLVKLRRRYPAARIDWLITPENADLVRHHPGLSNIVPFNRRDYAHFGRSWSASVGLARCLKRIWHTRYELVIDMHGQLRSALFTLASGAPVRIGFDRPRRATAVSLPTEVMKRVGVHGWNGAREGSWLAYSDRIPVHAVDAHAVDRYLWLGQLLGLDDGPPDLRVYWPAHADAQVDRLLDRHGLLNQSFALIVPTTIWPTKHWHVEGFAEVGRHLLRRDVAVLVAGSPKDTARCQAVVDGCTGARNIAGQTKLADLAALMNRSLINVTNDSGSMHLAVALGKPVVSVFGPTDPVRIGPYGRPDAVVRIELPCSPCYLKNVRQCPYEHACMNQVSAGMVIERMESVLAAAGASPLPQRRAAS